MNSLVKGDWLAISSQKSSFNTYEGLICITYVCMRFSYTQDPPLFMRIVRYHHRHNHIHTPGACPTSCTITTRSTVFIMSSSRGRHPPIEAQRLIFSSIRSELHTIINYTHDFPRSHQRLAKAITIITAAPPRKALAATPSAIRAGTAAAPTTEAVENVPEQRSVVAAPRLDTHDTAPGTLPSPPVAVAAAAAAAVVVVVVVVVAIVLTLMLKDNPNVAAAVAVVLVGITPPPPPLPTVEVSVEDDVLGNTDDEPDTDDGDDDEDTGRGAPGAAPTVEMTTVWVVIVVAAGIESPPGPRAGWDDTTVCVIVLVTRHSPKWMSLSVQ